MNSSSRVISLLLPFFLTPVLAQTPAAPSIADAKREFAAVFSHPDQPCQWHDNASYSICMGKEIEFTETHQSAFMAAIRAVAANFDSAPSTTQADKILPRLNQTDASWKEYSNHACSLQHALFQGGTGGAPAAEECELAMDRAYIRQIANMFNLKNLAP